LHCFIDDEEVARAAQADGHTRSHHAMLNAIDRVGSAIYAIGNAPTALLALCAAVRAGKVRPRLILALPVGFVSVIESKEEALRLDVPVIALRGRKGGSGITAAALNALLHLAVEGGSGSL
jgi:precorrin-8X/cobalt-precorrin-8 methylmutase